MNQMIRCWSVIGIMFLAQFAHGQSHSLSIDQAAELAIHGTSTLHEWTAVAANVEGIPAQINLVNNQLSIDALSITTAVESLDGGRGPAMNTKIRKALQAETHPYVTFVSTDPITVDLVELAGKELAIAGELTIGGESQSIELLTNITVEEGLVHLSGKRDLKMTAFNIEPPTAMFGQIKTNDDITIRFDVHYIMN